MTPPSKAGSSLRSRTPAATSTSAPTHVARASRNRKPVVDESTSSDEDVGDEGNADEDDEEAEEDDEEEEGDEDEDDEGDDEDAEGEDADMDDSTIVLPASASASAAAAASVGKVSADTGVKGKTAAAAAAASGKGTHRASMEDDEDEELSDLESMDEDDEGTATKGGTSARARGGDVRMEDEEDDEDEDDGESDNDEASFPVSRGDTPDLSKLTRRQRAAYEDLDGGLMALSNEAQKKKHLTAEEHAMRRAEMARRRKNLSEKRNEEEKMDTINRLLKKQAPKRRGRAPGLATTAADVSMTDAGAGGTSAATDAQNTATANSIATTAAAEAEMGSALYVRWINSMRGSVLAVPQEWLDAPVGKVFKTDGPVAPAVPVAKAST